MDVAPQCGAFLSIHRHYLYHDIGGNINMSCLNTDDVIEMFVG